MKIYFIPKEVYPTKDMLIEEVVYIDLNDFEWRLARVETGFIVKFDGDNYFAEDVFKVSNQKHHVVNTRCMFFQDASFDDFCDVRSKLKDNYTDDIWEYFTELLAKRFEEDPQLLVSEMFNFDKKKKKDD